MDERGAKGDSKMMTLMIEKLFKVMKKYVVSKMYGMMAIVWYDEDSTWLVITVRMGRTLLSIQTFIHILNTSYQHLAN